MKKACFLVAAMLISGCATLDSGVGKIFEPQMRDDSVMGARKNVNPDEIKIEKSSVDFVSGQKRWEAVFPDGSRFRCMSDKNGSNPTCFQIGGDVTKKAKNLKK